MDIDRNFTLEICIIREIVVIMGSIGNIILFIVFSRKAFRKNPVSIYCRALAIFDMFIIYSGVLDVYTILYDTFIYNYSNTVCVLVSYIYLSFGTIPGWILVAFSVDRALNLKRVTNVIKRPVCYYMIIIGIVLFNLLLYIEVPILLTLNPIEINGVRLYVCDVSSLAFGKVLNAVYIVEGSCLPFLIMFISSIFTIKKLKDSRRHVEMIGSVAEKRKSRDRKFAITSITFNVLFIVLKMPFVVSLAIGYNLVSYYFYQIAVSLFYFNYSISFFVHFFLNSLFRRELLRLLRIGKSIDVSNIQPIQKNSLLSNTKKSSDLKNPSESNNRIAPDIIEVAHF